MSKPIHPWMELILNSLPNYAIAIITIIAIKSASNDLKNQFDQAETHFKKQTTHDSISALKQDTLTNKQIELSKSQVELSKISTSNEADQTKKQNNFINFQIKILKDATFEKNLLNRKELRESCLKIITKANSYNTLDIDTSEIHDIYFYYNEISILIEKEIDNPYLLLDSLSSTRWVQAKNWFKQSNDQFIREYEEFKYSPPHFSKGYFIAKLKADMRNITGMIKFVYDRTIKTKDDVIKKGFYDDSK